MTSKELLLALAASAAGAGALAYATRWAQALRRRAADAECALQALQAALQHEKENRAMERKGRTNAEKQLRYVRMELAAAQAAAASAGAAPPASDAAGAAAAAATNCGGGDDGSDGDGEGGAPAVLEKLGAAASSVAGVRGQHAPITMFPVRPIGYLQTCFSTRNGTPRQPLLVPAARSVLKLAPFVSADCLEGLQQYSHCWVLYLFHANTNMPKVIAEATSGKSVGGPAPTAFKSKIRVPRLDGAKMGVLATRSPHRPAPIGLSVAQIIGVEGNRLILGGADIVDGSPVLDIKPYVPFCDSVPGAAAPSWVQAEAEGETLKLADVVIPPEVEAMVARVWAAQRGSSVYSSSDDAVELIRQVLSRDIRSLNQRLRIHPVGSKAEQQQRQRQEQEQEEQQRRAAEAGGGDGQQGSDGGRGRYIVVLDGMDVTYDLTDDGTVVLRGVFPLGGGVDGGEELAAAAAAEAEQRARQLVGSVV